MEFKSSSTTIRLAMHAMLAAWTLLGVAASSDPWPAAASTVDETADSYTTAYLNVTSYDVATGVAVQTEKSEIGKFGEYHVGAASGMLLHVIGTDGDRNGCAPPVNGVQEPPDAEPWIALVRRGKCSFRTKVDNARRAGASAVIVYNDREATDLDEMKLPPSEHRNVSAVFTYKWKGEDMARMLDDMTKRVMVNITIASNCTRSYGNINSTSGNMAHGNDNSAEEINIIDNLDSPTASDQAMSPSVPNTVPKQSKKKLCVFQERHRK